jgi:hypothetical protein
MVPKHTNKFHTIHVICACVADMSILQYFCRKLPQERGLFVPSPELSEGHLSRLSASEVSFVKQRDGISTYKGSCDDHMLIYMVMEDVSLIYRRAEGRDWQMHGPTWTNNICIMLLHKSPETSSSGIHS